MNKRIGILLVCLIIITSNLLIFIPIKNVKSDENTLYTGETGYKNYTIIDNPNSTKKIYYTTGGLLEDPSKVTEKMYPFNKSIQTLYFPSEFDWRNYNNKDWTTPIRNQGLCGSCWAFAALGALEATINIKEGYPNQYLDLSEQYVVSCLPKAGNCNGGWPYRVYQYIKDTSADGNYYNGIISESCFQYQGIDPNGCDSYNCNYPPVTCSEKCDDWINKLIPINDYGIEYSPSRDEIKQLLIQNGPVAASMDVYQDFKYYIGGIYRHSYGDLLGGHVIVIVGYNDIDGYWICKNSWGTGWGENGWFKIAYNECEIGSQIYWVEYTKTYPRIVIDQVINCNGATSYAYIHAQNIYETVGSYSLTLHFEPDEISIVSIEDSDFDNIFYSIIDDTIYLTGFMNSYRYLTGEFNINRIGFTKIVNNQSKLEITNSELLTDDPSPSIIPHTQFAGYVNNGCCGDMNGDGNVNSGDVRWIAIYVASNGMDPNYRPLYADGDVNCDGIVNSGDVRWLAIYVASNGMDPNYSPLYPCNS